MYRASAQQWRALAAQLTTLGDHADARAWVLLAEAFEERAALREHLAQLTTTDAGPALLEVAARVFDASARAYELGAAESRTLPHGEVPARSHEAAAEILRRIAADHRAKARVLLGHALSVEQKTTEGEVRQ
jgi:hypothetical protein